MRRTRAPAGAARGHRRRVRGSALRPDAHPFSLVGQEELGRRRDDAFVSGRRTPYPGELRGDRLGIAFDGRDIPADPVHLVELGVELLVLDPDRPLGDVLLNIDEIQEPVAHVVQLQGEEVELLLVVDEHPVPRFLRVLVDEFQPVRHVGLFLGTLEELDDPGDPGNDRAQGAEAGQETEAILPAVSPRLLIGPPSLSVSAFPAFAAPFSMSPNPGIIFPRNLVR